MTSLLPFIVLTFLNFAIWRRLNMVKEVSLEAGAYLTNKKGPLRWGNEKFPFLFAFFYLFFIQLQKKG